MCLHAKEREKIQKENVVVVGSVMVVGLARTRIKAECFPGVVGGE